jgi:hypothetical protein
LIHLRPGSDIKGYCCRWLCDFNRICDSQYHIDTVLALDTFFRPLPSFGIITSLKTDTYDKIAANPRLDVEFVFGVIQRLLDQSVLHNFRLKDPSTTNSAKPGQSSHDRSSNFTPRNPTLASASGPSSRVNTTTNKPRSQAHVAITESTDSSPSEDAIGDGGDEIILDDGGGDGDGPYAVNVVLPSLINADFSSSFYPPVSLSCKMPDLVTVSSEDEKFMGVFEALLDSGSTHHIFNSRDLFTSLDDSFSILVSTANSSSLEILGRGDVSLSFDLPSGPLRLILHGCLFAPDVPVNLLSVCRLVSCGVSCSFQSPGAASLTITRTGGSSFNLPVQSRGGLSWLVCQYTNSFRRLSSTGPDLALFTSPPLTPDLWHQRFCHLGLDATRAVLTKDYVNSISYVGSFTRTICPSCTIGKGAQQSHPARGGRSDIIGGLVHADICGPWPVRTPSKARYAFALLDDFSNFGFTFLVTTLTSLTQVATKGKDLRARRE